jgi:hypothetical protein
VKIETARDLAKLRGFAGRLAHDDEGLVGADVRLFRGRSTVARVICATESLAWDCVRICAGVRFRREDGPTQPLPLFA